MSASKEQLDWLMERLTPLGGVSYRRMFGGAGIYCEGVMFALVAYDELYFKSDAVADPVFDDADCGHFEYSAEGKPTVTMSYRRCPDSALDDDAEFQDWARLGLTAAFRADAAKPPAKRKRKPV